MDPHDADRQAELLGDCGLQALNEKVLASAPGEVLDVITEHNVAAMLVRRGFTDLEYEPPRMPRPVDLVARRGDREYRIEVKRLAASQHDELHSKVMATLNHALQGINRKVKVSLQMAESFQARDINPLVSHVSRTLRDEPAARAYYFPSERAWLVRYRLHRSGRSTPPRVAIVGDADLRDVTGDDKSRVQGKVRKAYQKFTRIPAPAGAVNMLVLETDRTVHLSSVAAALYGREHLDVRFESHEAIRGRRPDGTFSEGRHSRLGGVIIGRRGTHQLFGPYDLWLFPNPGGALPVDDVAHALGAREVLGPDDYP